jgi:hypothetical protein
VSDYLPKFLPGDSVPVVASATVVGGQLVTVAGAVAGDAATNVAGVAAFDVVSGGFLTVIRVGVHRLVASATITIGQPLCAAANGQVRPWVAGTDAVSAYIGRAWSAAAPAALVDATLFGV